jgi:hypothetical protein
VWHSHVSSNLPSANDVNALRSTATIRASSSRSGSLFQLGSEPLACPFAIIGGDHELALGEPDQHLETIGEQALALLEERFPGVRAAAREIEKPPSLSRRAKHALDPIALPSRHPRRQARRHTSRAPQLRRRLLAYGLAHPLIAVGTIALSLVVIVHFLTYVLLGVLALVTIDARRAR